MHVLAFSVNKFYSISYENTIIFLIFHYTIDQLTHKVIKLLVIQTLKSIANDGKIDPLEDYLTEIYNGLGYEITTVSRSLQ